MCVQSPVTLPPNEMAMQQIWRFRLWNTPRLLTTRGEVVMIVNPGIFNTGAGPDFGNAVLKIDGQIWVGSVEMHIRASDWHRHGHDGDSAYNNVILHVVGVADCEIKREDGTVIPTLVMSVEGEFVDTFNTLLHSTSLVLPTCGKKLGSIARVMITDWISALGMERLQRKSDDIARRFEALNGDWLQTVFITVARGLGFGHNAQPMEQLARSVPIRTLLKHGDTPQIVEALLFGQAGLLHSSNPVDEYERELIRDYDFYSRKYSLRSTSFPLWQMSSRNGLSTPYRRIALLAEIVCNYAYRLARVLSETTDIDEARSLFRARIAPYWADHSSFGVRIPGVPMSVLGKQSVDLMIINVVIPLMYYRAESVGDYGGMDSAVAMLEKLKPESNSIVRGFADYDLIARDAYTSQALVQLHREYCEPRRCLDCRLGHRLLSTHTKFQA